MHFVAARRHPLVEGAEQVAEQHPGAVRRHHTQPDLVGHHDRIRYRAEGVTQRVDARTDSGVSVLGARLPQPPVVHQRRQPAAEAVDEHGAARGHDRRGDVGGLHRRPVLRTVGAMTRHPGIPVRVAAIHGPARGDVGDGGRAAQQPFGVAGLTGAHAAGHQDPHPDIVVTARTQSVASSTL